MSRMKLFRWVDEKGYNRAAWGKEGDSIEKVKKMGIPASPPDLDRIELGAVIMEVHNQLVDQEIFTLADIQRKQTAVSAIIGRVLRRNIVELFKLDDQEVKK